MGRTSGEMSAAFRPGVYEHDGRSWQCACTRDLRDLRGGMVFAGHTKWPVDGHKHTTRAIWVVLTTWWAIMWFRVCLTAQLRMDSTRCELRGRRGVRRRDAAMAGRLRRFGRTFGRLVRRRVRLTSLRLGRRCRTAKAVENRGRNGDNGDWRFGKVAQPRVR